MRVCAYMWVYAHMSACMRARVGACTWACVSACMCVHVRVCVYVWVRECVYVWVRTMGTQCPWRSEGGMGSSETEITRSVRGSMRKLRTKLGWGRGVVLC